MLFHGGVRCHTHVFLSKINTINDPENTNTSRTVSKNIQDILSTLASISKIC